MKVQLIYYAIDNLNVAENGFRWKDRLILTNNNNPNGNVALAFVKIPHSRTNHDEALKDQGDALRMLTSFLACYHLTTGHTPTLITGWSTSFEIEEEEIMQDSLIYSRSLNYQSREMLQVNTWETTQYLQRTLPLFEKAVNAIENGYNKLQVALIMYYRAISSREAIEDFIDLVTALEALYSDGTEELRYKISLRASILTEDDRSKRHDLFEKLKNMYVARSKLVHGGEVPLEPVSKYKQYKHELTSIVQKSLFRFIDLAQSGSSHNNILKALDDKALGY